MKYLSSENYDGISFLTTHHASQPDHISFCINFKVNPIMIPDCLWPKVYVRACLRVGEATWIRIDSYNIFLLNNTSHKLLSDIFDSVLTVIIELT